MSIKPTPTEVDQLYAQFCKLKQLNTLLPTSEAAEAITEVMLGLFESLSSVVAAHSTTPVEKDSENTRIYSGEYLGGRVRFTNNQGYDTEYDITQISQVYRPNNLVCITVVTTCGLQFLAENVDRLVLSIWLSDQTQAVMGFRLVRPDHD